MKITKVEPIILRLDRVDTTRADGTQDAFLVRIHTDEGLVGIGEADTSPYLARTIVEMPSSHAIARGLRELLVGEDPLADRPALAASCTRATYHYGRGGVAALTPSARSTSRSGTSPARPPAGRSHELLGGARLQKRDRCTRAR